jgi:uncharacterized membrane protein YphA (DoxX/SURF4 family)
MTVVAALFLIVHGLLHLAIWVPEAPDDAPFDTGHSWLLQRDARPAARALALAACVLFVVAGLLLLIGVGPVPIVAIVASGVSLGLVVLTFSPWLLAAVAIDVMIVVVALR